MSNQLYSASDAATFLGVHRHTVRAWHTAGVLKSVRQKSNLLLFERSELERRKAEMQTETRRGRKAKEKL